MTEPRDIEFRQSLARLQSMLAIKNAQLLANPVPYLEDMARRCNELLETLKKVEYALSPDVVYDFWDAHVDKKAILRPLDINGEALIRCNAALAVIKKYRHK